MCCLIRLCSLEINLLFQIQIILYVNNSFSLGIKGHRRFLKIGGNILKIFWPCRACNKSLSLMTFYGSHYFRLEGLESITDLKYTSW